MISVPIYLIVGQVALLLLACFVLASAYRRLGKPIEHTHGSDHDDAAARLAGTALPDLGAVSGSDGSVHPPPRQPGAGPAVLLVYVLPGCETCQVALERLRRLLDAEQPLLQVHLLSVGADSSVDAYRRFDLPIWRMQRNLADVFGLKAYPVFLAVDETGMISASGSAHDLEALRSYLAVGRGAAPAPPPPHSITITRKP